MMKNVYEIFDQVDMAPTKEDKIYVLRQNATFALKSVLKGIFDPNVQFHIKEIPPYRQEDCPPGLSYTSINQEISKAYLFEVGNPKTPPGLTDKRRKEILIQMLETLEEREAKVFANMLMKKIDVEGVDYQLVKEAFPDILP